MSRAPLGRMLVDRREFVGACACTLAGFALGGCASLVTRTVPMRDGQIELALVHYPELAERDGSLRILPSGRKDPVYVFPKGDGTFVALSPICTHLGCTVEIEDERLVCPCHGSTYDRTGAVLQGPAQLPLSKYRTRVTPDGVILIDLNTSA